MELLYPSGLVIALSLVGYNALLTGFFVLFKRRDRLGFNYLVSSLFTFGWALGLSFLYNNEANPAFSRPWGVFSQVCFFAMPLAWFYFVLVYMKKEREYAKALGAVALAAAAFLALSATPWFILQFRSADVLLNVPLPGPAYKALSVLFFTVLVYAFWIFYEFWKQEKSPLKRSDSKTLFLAQLYGFSLAALSLLPAYGVNLPQYHFFLMPLWQFFLAYAMVRHHLLDFESLEKEMHRDKLASLSTLSAGMHHELKNPLTTIKIFAEYLPQKYDDPEFRKTFQEVVPAEVRRVNDLLSQLLNFSKPREPELRPVKLMALVGETLDFLKPVIEKSGVEIRGARQEDPEVPADRDQMKQVFLNLILNALQAMPEGGRLEVSGDWNAKGQFAVAISDTGAGIDPVQLKRIFDPFFTTKAKGTGLGLSIVQQILSAHGADIQVTSQPGRGTRCQISFKNIKR